MAKQNNKEFIPNIRLNYLELSPEKWTEQEKYWHQLRQSWADKCPVILRKP